MSLIDFAIITGLTEEFKVVKDIIPELQELSDTDEVWYRCNLQSLDGKRKYSVIATYQNDMGPLGAQALTSSVIKRWDPAYIFLVGIAGSFHESVRLGDVIVSQQVFHYDPGKVIDGRIQYRP